MIHYWNSLKRMIQEINWNKIFININHFLFCRGRNRCYYIKMENKEWYLKCANCHQYRTRGWQF